MPPLWEARAAGDGVGGGPLRAGWTGRCGRYSGATPHDSTNRNSATSNVNNAGCVHAVDDNG